MYLSNVTLIYAALASAAPSPDGAKKPTSLETAIGLLVSAFNEQGGQAQVLAILSPT